MTQNQVMIEAVLLENSSIFNSIAHVPENEISKKLTSFPGIRSVSHPRKLDFRKKFWMSFPGFANNQIFDLFLDDEISDFVEKDLDQASR